MTVGGLRSPESASETVGASASLVDALAALDAAGVRYCLLRAHGAIAMAGTSGDVDLLVAPADLPGALHSLAPLGFTIERAWGHAPHYFLVAGAHGPGRLKLDIVTSLRFGRPVRHLEVDLAAECLLSRRRSVAGWVPSPEIELTAFLLHALLDKVDVSDTHRTRLAALWAGLDARGRDEAATLVRRYTRGAVPFAVLECALAHGEWDQLRERRSEVQRSLFWAAPFRAAWWLASGGVARRASRWIMRRKAAAAPAEPSRTQTVDAGAENAAACEASRSSLRGSSLLLFGRLLATGLNFAAQVLVVRTLSTRDFGAFAYALAGAALLENIAGLGLSRGVARFAPIYHERRDWNRLFGVIALVFGSTLGVGALMIATLHAAPSLLGRFVHGDTLAVPLLLIMVFLVPLDALDDALAGLLACFSRPKAIFFRRHVLAPGMKLAAVALLIGMHASVTFLAWAYVASSLFGVFLYGWMLARLFQGQDIMRHVRLRTLQVPVREVFAFTIPLLMSDLIGTVMSTASTFFLGGFQDTTAIAHYRAVLPAARLNGLVMTSFSLLYIPQAARLFARGDYRGIDTLYWRTAVWVAVLSFPIFALTFSLAKPFTTALYGSRYSGSVVLLQLLAFAYYFDASTGFNGLTLKVLGKMRYVVLANLASVGTCVGLCALLVPRYGALGAAIATTIAMMLYTVLKQAGLGLVAGLRVFDTRCLGFYALLGGGAVFLALLQVFVTKSLWVVLPAAAVASLAIVWISKERLHVEETFPEILRIPVLGTILRARVPWRAKRRMQIEAVPSTEADALDSKARTTVEAL